MKEKIREKGTYGYIRQRQILTSIRTVLLFLAALGLYFAGYVQTGSNKNLLTIVSILGLLPAAKSMVNTIMFFRFRSLKKEEYERFLAKSNAQKLLYENILTTSEQAYDLKALFCKKNTIISYCEKAGDLKALEDHIREVMKTDHIDVVVKIFQDERLFLTRLKEMCAEPEEDSNLTGQIYEIIKAVSL